MGLNREASGRFFVGIGAPKAATTWLFRCLKEHPEVFIAACKETNFFDYATIDGRMKEYEAHFAGREAFRTAGEISTRYLSSHRAPARLKAYMPSARLFVSLRNPVEQVYSHYWHLVRQNFHQWGGAAVPQSFEEALEQYRDRLLEPAFYHRHIVRWLQHFDRSQLLILFYDEIRDRPQEVLGTVFSFLGVEASFRPSSTNKISSSVRLGTSPRSPALGQVYSFLYSRLNLHIYCPLKKLVGTRKAEEIKSTMKIRELLEFLFRRKGYPEMRSETRRFLQDLFSEDVRQLMRLTGHDLCHWK